MANVAGMNCFISGPMSGVENFNVGAFTDAHAKLKALEASDIYDPALEWLLEPLDEQYEHEHYMLECIHELTRVDQNREPYYDYLVQLDDWDYSDGATTELVVADACGIEVISIHDVEVGGE